jgi:hypothetical protein
VRSAVSPAEEDERDLSKVQMRMPIYEALVEGYLDAAGDFLNDMEVDHLAFSGKLITLEIGIRFLTDYLEGDVYFKTQREQHNLDRARTQLTLVARIEEQEEAMVKFAQAKIKNEFNEMSSALVIFDKQWFTMTENNRAAIWKYLKVLCVLCEKAKGLPSSVSVSRV